MVIIRPVIVVKNIAVLKKTSGSIKENSFGSFPIINSGTNKNTIEDPKNINDVSRAKPSYV